MNSIFSHLNEEYIPSLNKWSLYCKQKTFDESTHQESLAQFFIGSIYSFSVHVIIAYTENQTDYINLVIGDNEQLISYRITDSDLSNIDNCVLDYISEKYNKNSEDVTIENLYASLRTH